MTTERMNIEDVKVDFEWYPREKWVMGTVKKYADSMVGGASFPPIVLDRVTGNLLDGMHRLKAQEKLVREPNFIDTIDGVDVSQFETIDVEYHDIPDGIPPILYAAKLSSAHGDGIKTAEKRAIARDLYSNPAITQKIAADYLCVSVGLVNGYVKDLKAKQDESTRSVIMRLDRLGWTQQEIAGVVGMTQGRIAQKVLEISELKKLIKTRIDSGIPIAEVAEQTPIPLQIAYAIDNDGRTDAERMGNMGIKIQPYNVWNWSGCHELFGDKHPGRIPGELVAHVLYFYTQQGDMVYDPMTGSGTTQDVCLTMGRGCYGFDIDGRHGRPDVIAHDIDEDGWHDRIKKADLIFWDPPYFDKMDSSTIGDDGYIDGSISKLSREEYLLFFKESLTSAAGKVKKGCKLAFVNSDWDDKHGVKDSIFVWDYARIIEESGWRLTRHIQAPLPINLVHPDIVTKFRASRRLARLDHYVLMAERS